jgi:hypothetical protein
MLKALSALAVLATLAGCATTAAPGTPAPPSATAAVSGLPLGCKPDPASGKCNSFGTYYSGDDLRGTGAQHVGAALTQIDPAVSH